MRGGRAEAARLSNDEPRVLAFALLPSRAMTQANHLSIGRVLILAGVFWVLALFPASAQLYPKCEFCGRLLGTVAYKATDKARGTKHLACERCAKSDGRCDVCELPLDPRNPRELPDGRRYCERDWKEIINDQRESERIFTDVRRELASFLVPWGEMPDQNIVFTLVDKDEFVRQYRMSATMHDPSNVMGLTRSRQRPDGKFEHSIFVLNGLSKAHLMAVLAHEFTHAWLAERGSKYRQIHKDTVEGFCELMAWKLMDKLREDVAKAAIEENHYTHGQLQVLRAAEDTHRFYRVVDWMLDGMDAWLEKDRIDRVFVLRDDAKDRRAAAAASAPAWQSAPRATTPPVPDKLLLRGVIGTEKTGRTALINDGLFKANESARVRLGATNITLRCLEVRADSALVLVEATGEKQELRLTAK